MPLALVTGPREQLGSAGAALGRAGFDVVHWETATPPPLPGAPFDCYVQLPCDGPGGRAATDDLLGRIDALAAVAPRLGPTASILLGVDESDWSVNVEPGAVAPDLLAAVALALLEELGWPTARVAVLPVADLCRPTAEVRVGAIQWEMPTPPLVSAP